VTLRVYAHWLPDTSGRKRVDRVDEEQPTATPAQPDAMIAANQFAIRAVDSVVSRIFASWNQLDGWLRQIEGFGGRREDMRTAPP
jgi:hypothetical protein